MKPMKQQCYLFIVWLSWLGLPAIAILLGVVTGWWATLVVLLVGVFAQIVYIKIFPNVSRLIGYGSVEDIGVEPDKQTGTVPKITLYTANVCPFCPIVRQRLVVLQRTMGFELSEVDVTFQPGLIREKGIRSVPVIEASGRFWIGNATSAQLVSFLTNTKI
jgi:glutaredoxin